MTNLLADLLANKWDEPPEINAIKSYVRTKFQSDVGVGLNKNQVIIKAENAALAGTLRMHIVDLQKKVGSDKRIIIRIER